ncbi:MAG: BamA/TamA family outer membrane protein [Deltaproteobacteria bacterium]|nr:BamA/TamA family outer membrane protein [Deltaproteobacteria bacterium]
MKLAHATAFGLWLAVNASAVCWAQGPEGFDLVGPEELPNEDNQADIELIEAPVTPEAAAEAEDRGPNPRYVLEGVVVRGNRKTREGTILKVLGLKSGDVVTAADRRVVAARSRLLALGYFLDVRLSLDKGRSRGSAILVVEVQERGTIIINGLYLGTSEATTLWGGLDVAETNLLGRGVMLSGGLVRSSTPSVPGAQAGHAYRLGVGVPLFDLDGPWITANFIYGRGSEFFRAKGGTQEVDPKDHVAANTRRLGGRAGVGVFLSRTTRFFAEGRLERLQAALPDIRSRDLGAGRLDRIDFSIAEGESHLASVLLSLDVDTRDDPFLPRAGNRLLFSLESGMGAAFADYSFSKGVIAYSHHIPVGKRRHSFALHAFGGLIHGNAPYFDRFFVADLNQLLPPRALGQNFSTLPSYNFFDNGIGEHRFADYAGRVMLEYSVALWRGRGFFYRADLFTGVGLFALTQAHDLRLRSGSIYDALPVDATADFGVRLDSAIGIFNLSVANFLGRVRY